jgi:hypothetical protein
VFVNKGVIILDIVMLKEWRANKKAIYCRRDGGEIYDGVYDCQSFKDWQLCLYHFNAGEK